MLWSFSMTWDFPYDLGLLAVKEEMLMQFKEEVDTGNLNGYSHLPLYQSARISYLRSSGEGPSVKGQSSVCQVENPRGTLW
ncbi:hypothetical protein GDO81_014174 [Engystomops pustulosus]|uniref:Uncharacterized protein n=1 Tax=Engystomops pustulosus TaxID=76066 RepID=A0AAV7B8H0_ENGPU|nr:hypothetical protein GDO81_014174 [Engystomops pustulosus]